MGNNFKVVAVFVACFLVVAALQVCEAGLEDKFSARYKECFNNCEDQCKKDGQGYTFCEMKCDADCGAKEIAGIT